VVHTGNQSGDRPKQEAPRPLALLRRRALVPAADLLDYHGGATAAAEVADEGHVGRARRRADEAKHGTVVAWLCWCLGRPSGRGFKLLTRRRRTCWSEVVVAVASRSLLATP
jgi:hypothetical protein